MLHKLLVANRGEIARRIMRTCHRLGIATVAVYSDADAGEPHVREAGAAVRLGPAAAARSYLDVEAVVAAAVHTGVDAVHPGYGFLAENPALADACEAAGLVFVGPRPATIRLVGDKAAARRQAVAAGIPVVPGVDDADLDDAALAAAITGLGFPVLLKPAAGGGGVGMHAVTSEADLAGALAAARRGAAAAFGDDRLLAERLVDRPRHVEVQVLGDGHGDVVHLFERDCSLQRRHQKVVEEAPAPALDRQVRADLLAGAVRLASAVGYRGAGTVEFLLAGGRAFFLEMNARLQVEHPVTEMVTGLDLVELQLRVAAGEPLKLTQDDVVCTGHAIEARVYAEDPAAGFAPRTGRVLDVWAPDGPSVRWDAAVEPASTITPHYDPMVAKLVAHGATREQARSRLAGALRGTGLLGVTTNLGFLHAAVDHPAFARGEVDTSFVDTHLAAWRPAPPGRAALAAGAVAWLEAARGRGSAWDHLGPWRLGGVGGQPVRLQSPSGQHALRVVAPRAGRYRVTGEDHTVEADVEADVEVASRDGTTVHLDVTAADGTRTAARCAADGDTAWVHAGEVPVALTVLPATRHADLLGGVDHTVLDAPMPGTVAAVGAVPGQEIARGATLVVVEAMKMEHPVRSPADGTVTAVHVVVGDTVEAGTPVVEVEPHAAGGAGGAGGAAEPGA